MRCALSDTCPFCSIALRVVAADRTDRHELGTVHVERLVDARDDLDDLVVEAAVRALGHLGDEVGRDRLPVLVELDLAGRGVDGRRGQPFAQRRVVVRQIALDRVQALERRLGGDVVVGREQRRASGSADQPGTCPDRASRTSSSSDRPSCRRSGCRRGYPATRPSPYLSRSRSQDRR